MTFNIPQKILTIAYCICLIVIVFFLTPYSFMVSIESPHTTQYSIYDHTEVRFGNFFSITNSIIYDKFFIEIGILSIVYLLALIVLKTKN
jgi:hypothetical protein